MTTIHTVALALAFAAALAGCSREERDPNAQAAVSPDSIEGRLESNMASAVKEVHRTLATENISLDGPGGAPKAEITPTGDLLIDGRVVQVTDAQRRLLLDYRAQATAVAAAGAEVGVEGARLATRAMGEALRGVFNGDAAQVEQRIEAQAESIRASALKLCDRLPALYDTQQALAAALPAFAPYATMDFKDIDDCRVDATEDGSRAEPATPDLAGGATTGAPPASGENGATAARERDALPA